MLQSFKWSELTYFGINNNTELKKFFHFSHQRFSRVVIRPISSLPLKTENEITPRKFWQKIPACTRVFEGAEIFLCSSNLIRLESKNLFPPEVSPEIVRVRTYFQHSKFCPTKFVVFNWKYFLLFL